MLASERAGPLKAPKGSKGKLSLWEGRRMPKVMGRTVQSEAHGNFPRSSAKLIYFGDETFLDVRTDTLLVGVAHEEQLRVGSATSHRLGVQLEL